MVKQPHLKYRPFAAIRLSERQWPDRVLTQAPVWLSTDLRDGNQSLIEPMDIERKLRMFNMLVSVGFKEIEVGFPSASQTEFDFVRLLIEQGRIPADVTISVLTQARENLIQRTFDALEGVPRAIVHMYNATAPVMRRTVLDLDEEGVVELAVRHAFLIRRMAEQRPQTDWRFEYSPETFSDTELDFAKRIVDAVTEAWAPTPQHRCIINLPTTIERSTPNVFADMVEWMDRHLARRDCLVLSVHPHNDRGTGTAAGELALMAGAERIEGCLFGNGERTGNVDLVNIALNLYTQGVSPGLDFSDIDEVRRCVEHCNQLPVHPRHPYVGDLVYTSFSGSHQDAIRKAFAVRKEGEFWDVPYLPIDPKDLGRSYDAIIRVNSQSGKGGIAYLLEMEHGFELPRRLQIEFSRVVQSVMDAAGKELSAQELRGIFDCEYGLDSEWVSLAVVSDLTGGQVRLCADVSLPGATAPVAIEGVGAGPIDAFVAGLNAQGVRVKVLDYHEHALQSGANAQAVAYLELRVGDALSLFGVGVDANIVSASLKAIMSGLMRAGRRGEVCRAPASAVA